MRYFLDWRVKREDADSLRQHRIMGQGDSARDFGPAESSENAGILCVFPIFRTVRMGQKTRRSPQFPLCGVALTAILTLHSPLSTLYSSLPPPSGL